MVREAVAVFIVVYLGSLWLVPRSMLRISTGYWEVIRYDSSRLRAVEHEDFAIYLPATSLSGFRLIYLRQAPPFRDGAFFPSRQQSSFPTMNNLLEKAKSMSKVVVDSGAKTMLKVRMEIGFGCGCYATM